MTRLSAAYPRSPRRIPRIQGVDARGRIVAVGEGVDAGRIGERVLIEPVFRAPADWAPYRAVYFGSERDGAFAEFARAPGVHAHRIESPLSDAELASFPCAYSVVENMLERADFHAGETVLITGASGGVGSAAVQLAKRRGAIVIAVASASKADEVTSLGASKVVPRQTDLLATVGGEAVDVGAVRSGSACRRRGSPRPRLPSRCRPPDTRNRGQDGTRASRSTGCCLPRRARSGARIRRRSRRRPRGRYEDWSR